MMLLLYLVVLFLGLALLVMAVWQLWLIGKGETTVESSDNDYYRQVAKAQGKVSGCTLSLHAHSLHKLAEIRQSVQLWLD